MNFTTLIETAELAEALADPRWRIFDCRADLGDPDKGRREYLQAHVPGAAHVDLERDLSGPPVTDRGRHPLPTPEAMTETFRRLGIDDDSQVVAYDDMGGAFAARLWWMLRYLGHEAAAVLNGGWSAWTAEGRPTAAGEEHYAPGRFSGAANRDWLVRADDVMAAPLLIDARDPARYRGESEPLDPAAGHIPGAVNHFFKQNLDERGRFLAPEALRAAWQSRLGSTEPRDAISYCGSGVTACHNILALAHAGLGPCRLYAGSWSDWCSDPERPVATGDA